MRYSYPADGDPLGMLNWLQKHPWMGATFTFVVVTLPGWLSSVWSLFADEPLAIVVRRKAEALDLGTFSPYWITVPLGLVFYGVLFYFIRRRRVFAFNYSYGLALTGLHLGYDKDAKPPAVQIGLVLANAMDVPIKYEVESYDVIVDGRTNVKLDFKNSGGVIASRRETTFFHPALADEIFTKKEQFEGVVRFSIIYGHPEEELLRRMRRELNIKIKLGEKGGVVYLVISESDEAVSD